MTGNCHTKPDGKERLSYRCSYRFQTKLCDNGEISLPQLEKYVLQKLKDHLFTKDGMAQIAKQLNVYRQQLVQANDGDVRQMETRLKRIDLEIDNLTYAVSQGMFQQVMVDKMNSLQESKILLQTEIEKRRQTEIIPTVTEAQIQAAISGFEDFLNGNFHLPECRRFIRQYVRRIDVFRDYIRATFAVAFSFESAVSPALQIEMTATRDEIAQRRRRKKSFAVISKMFGLERVVTEIVVVGNGVVESPICYE